MRTIRIVATAAVIAGASVVMASPASAEPLDGTYFVAAPELADGGFTWAFTSCGPDCVSVDGGSGGQLTRQGSAWSGVTNAGCNTTIDENSLAGTYACPMISAIAIQLSKVG